MIRTGYLRWEIDVEDTRSAVDAWPARWSSAPGPATGPSGSRARGTPTPPSGSCRARGPTTPSSAPSAATAARPTWSSPTSVRCAFRYSESDRAETPRFWMAKLQREANAFAHEVVRAAAGFPQMVISSPALRAGYARLVEWEIFRVIEGRSQPQPTHDAEPMVLDAAAYQTGVPELVAAELVRDVVEPKEFDEFCRFDCVTVLNGGKYYRIPRRPHALIEVWDAKTHRAQARLCVVFQDPGMPPSDEVVMKYLLAKHQPDLLWQVGVRFSPPTGRFEAAPPRRWRAEH